ncbi:MAG: MerR family transcriptional regulator [Candidatus Planktophila sp.]|nr:MerR family transcriptional regulator [Candidatus Planktophila sp.]
MAIAEELLTVAAVARRVGVAPATLRTWDRRYGLGPSTHKAGAHRRYSALDVARLMLMRRLISTGVAPSDAAEKAKLHKGKARVAAINHNFESRDDLVKAIYKAAQNFDKAFIESELGKDLAQHGADSAWSHVIAPVLMLIGKTWEETGKGIEAEHLLTEIIKGVLRDSVSTIKDPHNAHPVLLAAVGEELHCLALHALAAALAERRIETHFLGSRTPLVAIAGMVKRSAPPAVFLWAQLTENAHSQYFRDLPVVRPAPRIVLGGPGWNRNECQGVVLAQDIEQACAEIERAVGL